MLKIQGVHYKFPILLFIIIFGGVKPALAQVPEEKLQRADSLFEQREYTEAFSMYNALLTTDRICSPAMLMKMAYIQEGLGEYSEALYYLNQYFLLTHEEAVLDKMKQLATTYNLRGYEYDDYDLLQNFFSQYRFPVIFTLLGLAIAGLFVMAWRRKKFRRPPLAIGVFYVFVLAILFVLVNYTDPDQKAIITAENTYIMSGPSAGAEVIAVSSKGHRVAVDGSKDVWLQIEWEGQPAYIRQGNVQIVNP